MINRTRLCWRLGALAAFGLILPSVAAAQFSFQPQFRPSPPPPPVMPVQPAPQAQPPIQQGVPQQQAMPQQGAPEPGQQGASQPQPGQAQPGQPGTGQPGMNQNQAGVGQPGQSQAQGDVTTPQPPPPTIIHNKVAVFAALDKVTARISHLEIPIGQSQKFGALTVTPRVCDTRPPTEPPHTVAFVEVDETKLNGEKNRIFTGWMFAESPGLNAVEHPVYDVWLTACKTPIGEVSAGNAPNAPAPSDNASSSNR